MVPQVRVRLLDANLGRDDYRRRPRGMNPIYTVAGVECGNPRLAQQKGVPGAPGHILGLGQAAIGISLASNFHDLLVAGNLPQRVGVGNASQDCIGGNPRRRRVPRVSRGSRPGTSFPGHWDSVLSHGSDNFLALIGPTRVSKTTRPFGSAQGRLRGTRRWLIIAKKKSRLHSQTRATRHPQNK